jgi:2-polyprenyl-6-methoxyphenol hydroxylase-like FAD-dependent oxidoreductase
VATEQDVPVLIAGGGPTGLFLALELAHRGVASVVVEPRTVVDDRRPRAKTTNARTMTHLRRLGLADRVRRAAPLSTTYAQSVVFCSSLTGFEVRRFENAFQLYEHRWEEAPETGQQVPQPLVERVLRDAIAAEPLVTFVRGSRLTDVDATSDGVVSSMQDAEGRPTVIRSEYLVGADGGSSNVRQRMGIPMSGDAARTANLNILFRSRSLAELVQMDAAVQYWVLRPGSAGIVGRADLEDTWWAMVQGLDDPSALDPVAAVRAMAGAEVDVEVLATDPWRANMRLADSFQTGRVFLAGDAAHLNPPWGGHGFNTCIGDAVNLGWRLAAVIRGWGGPGLLSGYDAERRPVAARTIRDATRNGSALASDFASEALDEVGPAGTAARRRVATALEVKESEFHSTGLVLGTAYGSSPHVVQDGSDGPQEDPVVYRPSAAPGHLLPHRWLADGSSLYDLLDDLRFTLLIDGELDATAIDDVMARARSVIPADVVVPVVLPTGSAGRLREWAAAEAVLVRPDQHIAWRGSVGADLGEVLRRVTGWVC